ncbi:cation-translocating P-type ATPase [Aneurinibacillus aneurinilyticus]|uniref:P-type Ca(2+) transporter n=1 Tax=Aneurinibacillus aneurinilyticus TaxID=1391 RepID=A0A848D5K6_ANEAE|nr:HAD-IC family P-type ATPase [Aneurinibacillus aneurinilyticus]NMF01477.1 HAD-IC family P-type ATPase [Aneurinibacillus aneurinilyticus]
MQTIPFKTRFIRLLPGRIRIEIHRLKHNENMANLIVDRFRQVEGIYKVSTSTGTGRALITYDDNKISLHKICRIIQSIEEQVTDGMTVHTNEEVKNEIDVTAKMTEEGELYNNLSGMINGEIPMHPQITLKEIDDKASKERVPIPLALSVVGLSALGIKQLFMGRSTLARSPSLFYLSGCVSVLTGYPFLKRGFRQLVANKKLNPDLLLGVSTLALALVRENVVVLAGLSLLNYLNWKRSQTNINEINADYKEQQLSPEIKSYSEKQSKWGMILGGATWALTRNPLHGMAVLLAANPRPAITSAEYAWGQANLISKERGYLIPNGGSLSQLSRTKTILFDDTSSIFKAETKGIRCISNQGSEDQVWCTVASLMKKSAHTWKEEVIKKAGQTGRTLRNAFGVEVAEQGIKGKIQGFKFFFGSKEFVQQNGVNTDEYRLEAKRLEKKGFTVQFVAKNKKCLGLLIGPGVDFTSEFAQIADWLSENKWKVGVLRNSLNISSETLASSGVDGSWLYDYAPKRVNAIRSQGEEVLFVSRNNDQISDTLPFQVPTVSFNNVTDICRSTEYANRINGLVHQHFRMTKTWNFIGGLLAVWSVFTAPVIALMANAFSLTLLSRTMRISEKLFSPKEMSKRNDSRLMKPDVPSKDISTKMENIPWHTMTREKVMSLFKVHEQAGLNKSQVKMLRNQYGPNQIEPKQSIPWFVSFTGQFKEFTSLILLGAAVLSVFSGGLFDGLAMGTILVGNAVIGTLQERKAEKVVEALNQFRSPICKVIREEKEVEISSTELVPGDIVCIEAGDRVPADLRLIRSWNLEVNEATLTGESLPVEKNPHALEQDCPLAERKNMLFMGTSVTRGKAIGLVVTTGMRTEMGYMISLMKGEEMEATPLQQKVTSISKTFIKGALAAGGLVLLAGVLRGLPITQMIATSITLTASAVPEGLPIMITIALSAGIFRMQKQNALVRRLSSLETLGRTTVICSDKTGTLTKNEMTVKVVATANRLWSVTGNGYEPIGTIAERSSLEVAATLDTGIEDSDSDKNVNNPLENPELARILQIGVLCNNSKLEQQEGKWIVKGDPTEGSLLSLAAKMGLWQEDMAYWERCHEEPFDSETKIMSVVCKDSNLDQDYYRLSKGSVEAILSRCKWYQENGKIYPLSDKEKQIILQQNEEFAKSALRVLGFAYSQNHSEQNEVNEDDLIFVGLVGMIDPPKPDVEKSIREANELGVKPVMITGDHPITAISIAKQIGIWNGQGKVLTGGEIDHLTDEELKEVVKDTSVFARVTPAHKLRIVTAFQDCGQIVAMTGDGVNDTPAIKKSNVGIAMGQTGTEVTKEAADMILKEDHIGSIVEGVKEGRTIIGNIRKAIGCLLTGNLAEVLVTSVAVIAGLPIPLVPIQILLMNLITDALPAMILAVNPGNKTKQTKQQDIVDKELYKKVVTRGVLLGAGSLGLFAMSLAGGAPLAVAQTSAFAALVAGQLMQTFSWRQEGSEETVRDWTKDRFFVTALGASWLVLLSAIYVPPLARVFHTVPLTFTQWIPIILVAGSVSKLSKPIINLISRKMTGSVYPVINESALLKTV